MLTPRGFLNELRRTLQKDERWNKLEAVAGPKRAIRMSLGKAYIPGLIGALRDLSREHGWDMDTRCDDYVEFRELGYGLPF